MNFPGKQKRASILPTDNHGEKNSQFKGVRMRKGGKWVSEVRIPNCRARIWLGSYDTAEQAARAFDAAIYCLRGPRANFNFPDSIPAIPSAASLSPKQIQLAAAKYARGQILPTCKNNCSVFAGKPISSTQSAMQTSSACQLISGELDFVLWKPFFRHPDGNQLPNLDKFLSLDAAALELRAGVQAIGPTALVELLS